MSLNIESDSKFNKLQALIYNIAARVYDNLGPGHSEKVYQKAMKRVAQQFVLILVEVTIV